MRYKVPQNVQREDQILWFITIRQLIILVIGGGISYLLYVSLKQEFELTIIENILIFVPAAIAIAFAFVKINGMSLLEMVLRGVEIAFFRPGRRYWISGVGEPRPSMTYSVKSKKVKKQVAQTKKTATSGGIKNLANILDRSKNGE